MDKKIFIIIGLIGLVGILLFMVLMSADGVRKSQVTIRGLEDQKSSFQSDLETLRGQNKQLQDQAKSLNGQLEGFNGEKARLQEQIDGISREKSDLAGQISKLNAELSAAKDAAAQAAAKLKQVVIPPPEPFQETPAQSAMSSDQREEYWAGLLKDKTALELRVEDLKKQLTDIRSNSEKSLHDQGDVDQEISSLMRENKDIKRELAYNKKIIDALTLDLAREKNYSFEIKDGVKLLKGENIALRSKLITLAGRKEELEAGIDELKARNETLEASVEKMQLFVKAKLEQMDALKNDFASTTATESEIEKASSVGEKKDLVQLPPIVIHPQSQKSRKAVSSRTGAQAAQPAQSSKQSAEAGRVVLAVNQENNFVVINKGSVNGVRLGDTFKLFDSNKQLAGEVVVIQVRENIAAADIRKEILPLKVGFSVR